MSCSRPLGGMSDRYEESGHASEGMPEPQRRSSLSTQMATELALKRTIETEVIPRLMLAHRAGPMRFKTVRPLMPKIDAEDIEEFTRLIASHADASVACEYIEALRLQGIRLDTIFLDLLTPAARRLGEFWEQDISDFADVTLGVSKLRQILQRYDDTFQDDGDACVIGRTALLVPMPGDQHAFGIGMVEQFFRRAGWSVDAPIAADATTIEAIVRKRPFDVVGLSLGSEALLPQLTSLINKIRRVSKNPKICVLVGGPVFLKQPNLVAQVGADATAIDGRQAVRQVAYLRKDSQPEAQL